MSIYNRYLPFLIIGIGIIEVVLSAIDGKNNYVSAPENFDTFNATELSGHLDFIRQKGVLDYFSIKEDPNVFYEIRMEELNTNEPHTFRSIAKAGDSIIKHRYSDTLLLFNEHTEYYFALK